MLCAFVILNAIFYVDLFNAMEISKDFFIVELGKQSDYGLYSIQNDKKTNNVSISELDTQNKKNLLKKYDRYNSSDILSKGKYKDGIHNNVEAIYLEFCEKVARVLKKHRLQEGIWNNRYQSQLKRHFFSLIILAAYKEQARAKIIELKSRKEGEGSYKVQSKDEILLSCYEKYNDQEVKRVVTVANIAAHSFVNCKIQLYCTDLNDSTSENFYLWIPGMIPHNVNDTRKFIDGHVPGKVLLYNGPVNNKYIYYTQDRYFKSYISSLLSAFNYHREACTLLEVLKYCYIQGKPVENISGICYGWQTLVCALHALVSNDEKAYKVKNELGINTYFATLLLKKIHYIEIQSPMLQLLPSVKKLVEFPLLYAGLIKKDSNENLSYKFCSSVSNVLAKCIFYNALPCISHVKSYNGDTLRLLNEISQTGYDLRHINLCMTWQKYDELVASVSVQTMNLLGSMFTFYPCGSSKGSHNDKSYNQHLYVNFIRKEVQVPFFNYISDDFSTNQELLHAVSNLEKYRLENNWQFSKDFSEDFF